MFARLLILILLFLAPLTGRAQELTSGPGVASVNGQSGTVVLNFSQIIGGCTGTSPCTTAGLLSANPCASSITGGLANVSDLYGTTVELMRCNFTSGFSNIQGASAAGYYWRPVRTDYSTPISSTGGTLAFSCFTNAPTQFVSGTLALALTVNLSTTNCWPGAQFVFVNNLTLGIFGITVTGLVGGITRTLGLNVSGTFMFGTDGAWHTVL